MFSGFVKGTQATAVQWWWQVRFLVLRALIVVAVVVTLLCMALFMYGTFYYVYMPPVSHRRNVPLIFSTSCDEARVLCSFPKANITLVHEDQIRLLMQGQPYRVLLDLEMPESPVNTKLGMFMVKVEFYARHGRVVNSAVRSTMLRYKSLLLQVLETLFYSPYLVLGYQEQRQIVTVVLFDRYLEDAYRSALGAYVEVQTRFIEIYSANLRIHASFSGLRYLLYNWPILSLVIGTAMNMFFLSVIALLSWWRFLVANGNNSRGSLVVTLGNKKKRTKKVKSSHQDLTSNASELDEETTLMQTTELSSTSNVGTKKAHLESSTLETDSNTPDSTLTDTSMSNVSSHTNDSIIETIGSPHQPKDSYDKGISHSDIKAEKTDIDISHHDKKAENSETELRLRQTPQTNT